MEEVEKEKVNRIRTLNDRFRRTLQGGKVMLTSGVNELGPDTVLEILTKVRLFHEFNEANDPYGEHDFGSFEHKGEKFFFKIDYYNADETCGSEDPSDPSQTSRIMTVMLANEY